MRGQASYAHGQTFTASPTKSGEFRAELRLVNASPRLPINACTVAAAAEICQYVDGSPIGTVMTSASAADFARVTPRT